MRISDWSSDVCSSDLQFTQGAIQSSLNVMDMSIMGEGFFMVKSTSGTTDMSFTRNGSFSVNSERFVVDSGGQALQRSEEHTSELQSLMRISYAVFCLKKKITTNTLGNIIIRSHVIHTQ